MICDIAQSVNARNDAKITGKNVASDERYR